MSQVTALSTALTHIAAAAPLEFNELKKAAAAYSAAENAALVTAGPDEIFTRQGRAQTAALLLSMIENVSKGANTRN